MVPTELHTLVAYLRQGTPRTRVGLWRAPLSWVGKEADVAISLHVQAVDVADFYLSQLPKGADFARLSPAKIVETLDTVASSLGSSNCVLVYNLDLLLAGISSEDRQQVWQDLFNRFPHRLRALVIMLAETAVQLLPTEQLLEKWENESRLV